MEYSGFHEYRLAKWEYGRRQADRLICAAQVVAFLRPNWSHRLAERESQLRPLDKAIGQLLVLVSQKAR